MIDGAQTLPNGDIISLTDMASVNSTASDNVRAPLLHHTLSRDGVRTSLRTVSHFPPTSPERVHRTTPLLLAVFSWWHLYYAVDFLVAASLWGASTWTSRLKPYQRAINPLDPDVHRKYHAGDIIPMSLVTSITIAVPLLTCLSYHLLLLISRCGHDYYIPANRAMKKHLVRESLAYVLHDTHHLVLALFLATGATKVMTDLFKVWMGRFRPDFLDRCQFDNAILECTGEHKLIRDGRESWPSGHTSASFCGMGLVSLYLAGKLSAWCVDEPPYGGRVFSLVLSVMPLIGAAYIGISRTEENKHHPTDVLSGAVLGFAIAYISYRLLYPSVFSGNRKLMKKPKGFSETSGYVTFDGENGQVPNPNA
ncbi:hypothetical protein SeMB42_g00232 [Synchytrium endobioticum]|uniref:Phosphatidic acid phosphatase type 2/haloperoxidase domain-containing protein n=1 Tax=Synchytrium endobioticum TaxID=286115 RepID=A0A507CXJ3_9FUNG|nr:hypothetical protein SeLEV6574_g04839 [Synchytrium endobioticum]TPX54520.1 hypothetical protein SeMB42_g00232 [Synchytrium endobioticum]